MVKVIATDLDGTLLKPRKIFAIVEKENKNFVREFYGDTVIVSGRDPKFCAKVCNCLKINHNFIALNGAVIVKEGTIIYRQSMKKSVLNSLLEFLEKYYTKFEFLIFDKYDKITCFSPINILKIKFKYFKKRLLNGRLNVKIKANNKKTKKLLSDNTPLLKALIYNQDNLEDMYYMLTKEFGDHFSFFNNGHSIEISPIGVSKGSALKYLIDTTAVKSEEVFVVGDDANDISMFEMFDNSFVMNHAKDNVKIKAKHKINKFSELINYTRLNDNFKEES